MYCSIFPPVRVADNFTLLCVDHAVRFLSEIWQDNYLSAYTTTQVATQQPKVSGSYGSQDPVWRAWNPLQYSVVFNNSRPYLSLYRRNVTLSPYHRPSVAPLFQRNPVWLLFKASCRSASAVLVPLEPFFRLPSTTAPFLNLFRHHEPPTVIIAGSTANWP